MVSKSILNKAKSFLCWDVFSELTIQLIEIKEAVSYFLPPSKQSTIVIFYDKDTLDFIHPLFQLFHEAGHLLQYQNIQHRKTSQKFWDYINIPTGPEKVKFEQQGWNKGYLLLKKFIKTENLNPDILREYDTYAAKSIETYK